MASLGEPQDQLRCCHSSAVSSCSQRPIQGTPPRPPPPPPPPAAATAALKNACSTCQRRHLCPCYCYACLRVRREPRTNRSCTRGFCTCTLLVSVVGEQCAATGAAARWHAVLLASAHLWCVRASARLLDGSQY